MLDPIRPLLRIINEKKNDATESLRANVADMKLLIAREKQIIKECEEFDPVAHLRGGGNAIDIAKNKPRADEALARSNAYQGVVFELNKEIRQISEPFENQISNLSHVYASLVRTKEYLVSEKAQNRKPKRADVEVFHANLGSLRSNLAKNGIDFKGDDVSILNDISNLSVTIDLEAA